jgi:hypothetical protein
MVKFIFYILLLLFPIYGYTQIALLDDIKTQDKYFLKTLYNDTTEEIFRSNFIKSKGIFDFFNKTNSYIHDFTFVYNNLNNSILPNSFNDGNIYPSKGVQERFSLGLSLNYKWLDIRLQPEYIKVENKLQDPFLGYPADGNWWARYYLMINNNIDNFSYMSKSPIYDLNYGQSRIGFKNKYFSTGISNENIWWGPGFRNSLIFTNNAPGFKHAYFNIPKPISIGFGELEFYALNGILDNTIYTNPDNEIMQNIWNDGIEKKSSSDRIISAFNLTLQPRYFKNLYIGFSYANQFYQNEIVENKIINQIFSKNTSNLSISSLYFKYHLPIEHAEIYGEFGQQSPSTKIPNIFSDTNRVGYIIGVRKLTPINDKFNFLLGFEFTKLSLSDPRQIFIKDNIFGHPQKNSWYTSSSIKQGYTNQAQLLGASIGPGSNSQSAYISINSIRNSNKILFFAERIIHDEDFYHYVYVTGAFGNSKSDAYWVDLNWGIEAEIEINKSLLFATSFLSTNTMNYKSVKNGNEDLFAQPGIGSDKHNLLLVFSIKLNLNGIQ